MVVIKKSRTKHFVQAGVGLTAIAIAVVVAFALSEAAKPELPAAVLVGPRNIASNGVVLSGASLSVQVTRPADPEGKPKPAALAGGLTSIVTYFDYQCPGCRAFEKANGAQLAEWVKAGTVQLEIHPISFLDLGSLGNRYSTRAANAAVCVADLDPDHFYGASSELFTDQPEEATHGRTEDQLIESLRSGGASSDELRSCVKSEKFASWVGAATAELRANGIVGVAPENRQFGGTPSTFVNGVKYQGSLNDPLAFATFVASVKARSTAK